MTASAASTSAQPPASPHRDRGVAQLPLGRAVALHLLPGVAIAAIFYGTAPLVMRAGFPAIAAGMVAAVVGILGVELGLMLRDSHRQTGRWSLATVLPWRPGPFTWRRALLVVALMVWQVLAAAVMTGYKAPVVEALFWWLPTWAVNPLPEQVVQAAPQAVLLITAAALLLINGILGPLGEELYFRGYLLPRVAWLGAWAPLANVALFSLYHFWTPWDFLLRIVLLTPMAYATWRTRDIRIAILCHCGINTLGFVLNTGPALLGG